MNQCDGCRRGNKPDSAGYHRNHNGDAYMVCQADKYPKGLIDLTRMAKAGDGASIEPGRRSYFLAGPHDCEANAVIAGKMRRRCSACGKSWYIPEIECQKVRHGIECVEHGYPYFEAAYSDRTGSPLPCNRGAAFYECYIEGLKDAYKLNSK